MDLCMRAFRPHDTADFAGEDAKNLAANRLPRSIYVRFQSTQADSVGFSIDYPFSLGTPTSLQAKLH
jgi:hypothetical protein